MYYNLNAKTGCSIEPVDESKELAPKARYGKNNKSPYVGVALSGRNKFAQVMQETVKGELFNYQSDLGIRKVYPIFTLSDSKSRIFKVYTNVETHVTPSLMSLLWTGNPETFFQAIAELEETYAKESKINHEPWFRSLYKEKFEGSIVKKWEDVAKIWPEFFQLK